MSDHQHSGEGESPAVAKNNTVDAIVASPQFRMIRPAGFAANTESKL